MKIVLISDTHTQHNKIQVPDGDLIIFSGDLSYHGYDHEILAFLKWYSELPHTHKVMIAGNHDFGFESKSAWCREVMPTNIHYLNDSGVTIEGINIWGSPITPWFHSWAFNRFRGLDISKHWELIPKGTDILITHGPAHKHGDKIRPEHVRVGETQHIGCKDLLHYIKKIKPKLHVFGHIHECSGFMKSNGKTLFVNASSLDANYKPVVSEGIVIDWLDIDELIKKFKKNLHK